MCIPATIQWGVFISEADSWKLLCSSSDAIWINNLCNAFCVYANITANGLGSFMIKMWWMNFLMFAMNKIVILYSAQSLRDVTAQTKYRFQRVFNYIKFVRSV